MIERLKKILYSLGFSDAKHESGSKRNGLFSYAGEVHSFLLGVAAGFASGNLDDPRMAGAVMAVSLGYGGYAKVLKKSGKEYNDEKAIGEISREPWYAIGGVIVGYLFGYGSRML